MTAALIRYDAARAALAECKAIDEVKTWADKAAAMQAYGRMAKDKSLEVDAADIRLRAERQLGTLIAAQKADGGLHQGGRPPKKTGAKKEPVFALTLAEVGIDKKQSSRAQKLAAVPEAEFEAEMDQWRERMETEGARVTARLELAGERAQKAAEPDAPHDSIDEVVDRLNYEIQRTEATLVEMEKSLAADDAKAYAALLVRRLEHAERAKDSAMADAKRWQESRDFYGKQLARCGRAVGERDLDKIAPAVEAMARSAKVAA